MKTLFTLLVLCFSLMANASDSAFFNLKAKGIKGNEINFSDYKGKTILIVNIASQCGYTPQLQSLQELYERFRNKNFTIIGVPSNEFGGQSPESDEEMIKFCKLNYGVSFPLLSKTLVKGKDKHPIFNFLLKSSNDSSEISWNFEKFLIDGNGNVVSRFRSGDSPTGEKILDQIKKVIN